MFAEKYNFMNGGSVLNRAHCSLGCLDLLQVFYVTVTMSIILIIMFQLPTY